MMEFASVGDRGQVTLPKELRDELKIKSGDKVVFIEVDGNYILKKVDEDNLREFLLIDHREKYDASGK
ncbi:AbrB/MazE/SpoVT family DNA-binding domain-containing protein [Paenibacillus alvei]|uniref:AbrB/MazE/SpoVT family DNA-binding domain-containing protein n=1 Tax=Paenibacillus alvei TaxID=44250 RepID=UPI00227F94CA|nr:AbrB/MazE/SpoVT family DNA-binding domain-containing protein [Paenibacillus alvei]